MERKNKNTNIQNLDYFEIESCCEKIAQDNTWWSGEHR